jgi:hypothetical protein
MAVRACASLQRSWRRSTTATRRAIWHEAKDSDDLKKRLDGLPGFGSMKVTGLGAVLARRFGVEIAEPLAPGTRASATSTRRRRSSTTRRRSGTHKAALRADTSS